MALLSLLRRIWPLRRSASTTAKRPPSRRLALEPLESRSLMAALIANRLSDVTVTASSVQVADSGPPATAADRVLVIRGTSGHDVLSVAPSATPGVLSVNFNGQTSNFTGPFAAIVMHGEKGNDQLSLDAALTTRGFLFGGVGNDTLLGGAAGDVLVGGDGNDVLQGRTGRDILLGGTGADSLYGYTSLAGPSESDNFLVSDLFSSEHSLAMLQDLTTRWSNGDSLADRTASLRSTLVPATRGDGKQDQVYQSKASDPFLTFSGWWSSDKVFFAVPGVAGTWFSNPPAGARIANRLSDITVSQAGVTVATSASGNAADRVLVLEGTAGNDVISVLPSSLNATDFVVVYNAQTTYFAGPFSAIVAHGGRGHDTIRIDPALQIDTFLFGGYHNDTLTGGGGADVLVGGDGNDVLIGGGGRDLLLGGNHADVLYGNSTDSTAADDDNFFVPDLYYYDHGLPILKDLRDVWTGSASRAARIADLSASILPAAVADPYADRVYKPNGGDGVVSLAYGTRVDNQMFYAMPGFGWVDPTNLPAVFFADTLAEVAVTSTGLAVYSANGNGIPSDRVLVVSGTRGHDNISIQASSTLGNLNVVYNGQTTTVTGPYQAILVHGGLGNDTISVSGTITTPAFLFGGSGHDTLTGGGGNDVLVGGEHNDKLFGGMGRDLLFGGAGSDTLYGKTATGGGADGDNFFVTDNFSGEYALPTLVGLANDWGSVNTRADRIASVSAVVSPASTTDVAIDKVYQSHASDAIISTAFRSYRGWIDDQVRFAIETVSGAWYSHATRDADGFDSYTVESAYQRTSNVIRVLRPSSFDPLQQYRSVYVLPVGPGLSRQFGDGLLSVRDLGVVNNSNAIFVAPSFTDMPWYADNDINPQIRQESFLRDVVTPLIESQYPVVADAAGRLLLGFSKSGYGAFTMMLRNPDFYGKAFAYDSPLAMANPRSGWGFPSILGSAQNFENYRVTSLLTSHASEFQNLPARFLMLGYGVCLADLQAIDQQMTSLGIPHVYHQGIPRWHVWNSGWMGEAVQMLLS